MIWILLKFIASSAILYLLFYLFLGKEKSFLLNRWVLLFIVPCAMLIPFLSLPVVLPQEVPVQTTYIKLVQNQEIFRTHPEPSRQNFSLLHLLTAVYLPVFLILLVKKLKALSNLITWTREKSFRHIKGAFLVLSPEVHTPFSFGKYIFMHP